MPENTLKGRYSERSLRDFLYVLFRHKWKALLFFLVVFITVALGTLRAPEFYRSEAKLLVKIGRESVTLDPTATTGQVISVDRSRESEINSELEILKSRELAQKVVDKIGPEAFLKNDDEKMAKGTSSGSVVREWVREIKRKFQPALQELRKIFESLDQGGPLSDREKALIQFTKNLTVEGQKNSNILSISFEAQNPTLAQTTVADVIDFYLDKHITTHRTPGSYEFFDKQVGQLRVNLAQTEEQLRKLKNKTGVASIEEQRRATLDRITALQKEMEATQASLSTSKAKVQSLEKQLAGISQTLITQTLETTGSPNYGPDLMRARLYELRLKEQDLLSKYKETSIPVKEIRRQIVEAEALLPKIEIIVTQQVTKGINTTHQQLDLTLLTEKANLSSLQSKDQVLKSQIGAARREFADLNNFEYQMVSLQRELSLQESKYKKHIENLEQARIDQALETNKISNISIIQAASYSRESVRPRKALNLLLGLFLAIFGGIGIAFFSEYLDHSLRTPQDVEERLQLPVLASIPK